MDEAQGLIRYPGQPSLREMLWLLLPEGRLPRSSIARHLIRFLRRRVAKAEEGWIPRLDNAAAQPKMAGSGHRRIAGQA